MRRTRGADASPCLGPLERGRQLRQAFDIVHRKKIIDMRQQGLDARGPRLEAVVTKERIEPYQAPTGFVQAFCLRGKPRAPLCVETIANQENDGSLAEETSRPSSVEFLEARADPRPTRPVGYRRRDLRQSHINVAMLEMPGDVRETSAEQQHVNTIAVCTEVVD